MKHIETRENIVNETADTTTFKEAYTLAITETLETIFLKKDKVDILRFSSESKFSDLPDDYSDIVEWDISLDVLFLSNKYDDFISADLINRVSEVYLTMETEVDISRYSYRYVNTKISSIYLDGSSVADNQMDPSLTELINSINEKISNDPETTINRDIRTLVNKKWYSKFF